MADTANSKKISRPKGSWLKQYQFQPGQSGNPNGRPRKLITEAYTEHLHKKCPTDSQGRTYAQLLAQGQINAAIKGKAEPAKEIADRVEGKVTDVVLNVNLTAADERVKELLNRRSIRSSSGS